VKETPEIDIIKIFPTITLKYNYAVHQAFQPIAHTLSHCIIYLHPTGNDLFFELQLTYLRPIKKQILNRPAVLQLTTHRR